MDIKALFRGKLKRYYELEKINLYILFACAFNWTVVLIMYLAHIKMDSILGVVLLAALYMPGPALATFIIQKYIYKKGFKEYGWTFDRKAIKRILFTPLVLPPCWDKAF